MRSVRLLLFFHYERRVFKNFWSLLGGGGGITAFQDPCSKGSKIGLQNVEKLHGKRSYTFQLLLSTHFYLLFKS